MAVTPVAAVAASLVADAAFWIAAAFVGVQLLVALVNAATFPRLRAAAGDDRSSRTPSFGAASGEASSTRSASPGVPGAPGPRATVSLLVPARNEAANLARTLPQLLTQGADEVIVLDDASDDGTGAALREAEARHATLRVVRGTDLPDGWNGKNWACHQLAQVAAGDVWVFTDADVDWRPGALDALLTTWRRDRPGLATVWPRQRTQSWAERIAVPQIDMILLGSLPHPLVRHVPFASLAAASGQAMAWSPAAYRASGGHAAVRGEVLEDVRLAQRAKAAGVRLSLALGGELVEARMYTGAADVVAGFAKNVLAAAGSVPALVGLTAVNVVAYLAAWPLALLDGRWAIVAVGGVALRALASAIARRPVWEAVLQPAAPLVLLLVVARSLRRSGGYEWKGRSYAVDRRR